MREAMSRKYEVDLRPFADRIIHGLGYKETEAIKLVSGVKQLTEDYGSLMPIQGFIIPTDTTGTVLFRSIDVKHLNTWSDHYKACQVPFVVVRESSEQIVIYKKRVAKESRQAIWIKGQKELN